MSEQDEFEPLDRVDVWLEPAVRDAVQRGRAISVDLRNGAEIVVRPTTDDGADVSGWVTRLETFLATVGASTPEDHQWVTEAQWLLDNAPSGAFEASSREVELGGQP